MRQSDADGVVPRPATDVRQTLSDLGFSGAEVISSLLGKWPEYVMVLDSDGVILHANQQILDVLGRSQSEVVGLPAATFLPADERPKQQESLARIRRRERVPLFERRFYDRDGNVRTVEVSISQLSDDAGRPVAMLSLMRDITERRRTEIFTRQMVEQATAAVGSGYLANFCRALVSGYGVTAAGILRVDRELGGFAESWYAVDCEQDADYPRPAGVTPHHEVLGGRRVQIERDTRVRFPGDAEIQRLEIESYAGLPLRARSGDLNGILFLMNRRPALIDVDQWLLRAFAERAALELEHIEQNQALEKESRRRHRLLRHVSAVLYERGPDPEQGPEFFDSSIESLTGHPLERWARPLSEWIRLVDERDRDRVLETITESLQYRQPYRVEFRVTAPEGGQELWLRDEATPLYEDGRVIYAGVLLDVSAQRALQEQVANTRRLESIGFLAAGVAHDFNNLLMTSIGQLSLLKAEQEGEAATNPRLSEIEDTLVRAAGLTRQMQSLAKGGDPIRRPCDLRETILRTARFATEGTGVEALFEIDSNLWPCMADEGQIAQVIENLVINATQAMPRGGELKIQAANEEVEPGGALPLSPGRYVRFAVADSGAGIEPDVLDRIFDPYFSTKEKGFGLGLASSHAIVRRHGGILRAESRVGDGTTMVFYLMAGDEDESAEYFAVRESPGPRPLHRVLVLDDDAAVQRVVVRMLRKLGLEVVTAQTGEQAIERVRSAREAERQLDFALLDLTIRDGLGGRQAAHEIRKFAPELPLVATSGYSEDPIMSSFHEHGFDDCLPKPYTLEQLRELLARI